MKIKIYMHAAFVSLLLTVACGLNARGANAQESAHFKGSIGKARFEMTLSREGNNLSGTYFYVKSGSANTLSLRGKIDAKGNFTLQEFNSSGTQTGEFKGTWEDDPNQSGSSLVGQWKKPGAKEGQDFSALEQMLFFTNGAQIIDRRINEFAKAKKFPMTAEYPELTGGTNAAGFNQLVKSRIDKRLADFKKEMMGLTAEDLKTMSLIANSYIDIGYNVEYADNDLISVSVWEESYEGGVHGNYSSFTITYDLKNGREIKLSELFKPGAKYLEAISAYATKDLQSRKDPESKENLGLAQDIFAEGVKPTLENYRNWNITKKGLMFGFDPYQVGPYVAGPQSVIIPYAKLKEIAKPGGALMKMMK